MLKILKNRLRAMTRCEQYLLNLDKIGHKYQINTRLILNDYFGFDKLYAEDQVNSDELINKLNQVKNELLKITRLINTEKSDSIVNDKEKLETVPRALISLKFKLPMFYVNRLNDFIKNERQDNDEFYKKLYDIKIMFNQNKNDLQNLNKLVIASKH